MTEAPAPAGNGSVPEDEPAVDRIVRAVREVPGVVDLNGGVMGEVGTYLPGRRVAGVRLHPDRAEVQVIVEYGRDVRRVADSIQTAVQPLSGTPVNVTVADVALPEEFLPTHGSQRAGESSHAAARG